MGFTDSSSPSFTSPHLPELSQNIREPLVLAGLWFPEELNLFSFAPEGHLWLSRRHFKSYIEQCYPCIYHKIADEAELSEKCLHTSIPGNLCFWEVAHFFYVVEINKASECFSISLCHGFQEAQKITSST